MGALVAIAVAPTSLFKSLAPRHAPAPALVPIASGGVFAFAATAIAAGDFVSYNDAGQFVKHEGKSPIIGVCTSIDSDTGRATVSLRG